LTNKGSLKRAFCGGHFGYKYIDIRFDIVKIMENLSKKVSVKPKRVHSKESKQHHAEHERQRRQNMKKKLAEADRTVHERDLLSNKLKRIRLNEEELKQMESMKEEYNQMLNLLNQKNTQLEQTVQELRLKVEEWSNKAINLEKIVTELKQQRDSLLLDLGYFKQLETQLHKLQDHLETVESEKVQMELEYHRMTTKSKQEIVNSAIVNNSKVLIDQLPQNSPFRCPLLFFLLQGLSSEEAIGVYGISQRTFGRVMEDNGSTLVNQLYAINVTRSVVTQEQIDLIKKIINDILPVQSGRFYRYQEETDNSLYERYVAEIKSGKAVSKSFFIYKILAKENIHHSKAVKFCPICELGDENSSVIEHKRLISIQHNEYKKQKQAIATGKNPNDLLITQDFTQLELEGSFVQDQNHLQVLL
jgi:hypothetical protein